MTDSRRPDDPSELEREHVLLHAAEGENALSAEQEQELLLALAHAQAPTNAGALAAHDRAWKRALARHLDEPLDEPAASAEELEALAAGDDATFFEALRAAHAPTEPNALAHARILRTLLAQPARRRLGPRTWAASALALAAAVLLGVRVLASADDAPTATRANDAEAALSRSTEPLVVGVAAVSTSGRVNRIAQARTDDYRKNRFRSWGVR